MIRNYKLGESETLRFSVTDFGSVADFLRYDGLEPNAFTGVGVYSDSGYTTAIPSSSWEYYTTDAIKTSSEAETGGTGETVYSQIKITDATYQTGTLYIEFDNFGTYPDGDVQGTDYIEIDADYSYTTQRNLLTYIKADGLTAETTITVSDGGFDERSITRVKNADDTYKIIVSGDVDYWVTPGQSVDFYYLDGSLVWASAGWELVYEDLANTTGTVSVSSQNINSVAAGEKYHICSVLSSDRDEARSSTIEIVYTTDDQRGGMVGTDSYVFYDQSASALGVGGTTVLDVIRIQRWHNGV
jgi:hypothetical protein